MIVDSVEHKNPDIDKLKSGFANTNKLNFDDFGETDNSEAQSKSNSKYGFFIVLAFFLLVNILAILLFVFDVGSIRTKLITYQSTATDNRIMQEQFDEMRVELEAERTNITEERALLREKENVLTKKEQELNSLRLELTSKEKSLNELEAQNAPDNRDAAEKQLELTEIIKIYENMEASSAAKIISALDMSDIVRIIKSMKKTKASEILAVMDPALGASIMKEIMK